MILEPKLQPAFMPLPMVLNFFKADN